jgi:hypothetical protein
MYDMPVTPSKPRWQSKTHLINLAIVGLAAAEARTGTLQAFLPVNVFALLSFLLPVVNMVLRENTDRAVGMDGPGVSRSNRIATAILVGFAMILLAVLFLYPAPAKAAPEKPYADAWCQRHQGVREFRLPDGARVDCLTATHAVEIEWAHKWAEAIGQALYYAPASGKRAGIVIIAGPKDGAFLARLHRAIDAQCLPIDVWEVVR